MLTVKALSVGLCMAVLLQGCLVAGADKATCEAHSGKDCHFCLQYAECFYCTSTKACTYYPWKFVLPRSDTCPLADIRWGSCWVNFLALIISMVVIVLVIVTAVACWCHFWCKRRRIRSVERDERRFAMESQMRQEAQAQRRAERQSYTDAIRQKYGLSIPARDSSPPYQPF